MRKGANKSEVSGGDYEMTKQERKVQLDALKGMKGEDRRHHFATGGSVAAWRGRHTVTVDRRKAASKGACRGRVAY